MSEHISHADRQTDKIGISPTARVPRAGVLSSRGEQEQCVFCTAVCHQFDIFLLGESLGGSWYLDFTLDMNAGSTAAHAVYLCA